MPSLSLSLSLLQYFKANRLINGLEGVDYSKFFSLENHHYNVRGHSKKIAKTNMSLDVRNGTV